MGYQHKVVIVRDSGSVTRLFDSWDKLNCCASPPTQVDDYIRNALKMPKTLRVEVTETDTQLYAYPPDKRSYQRGVFLKDGRNWQCYGHGANVMWLYHEQFRIA